MRQKRTVWFVVVVAAIMLANQDSIAAKGFNTPQGSYVSFVDVDSNSNSSELMTPEARLNSCVELAKSGEIEQAFDNVRSLRDLHTPNGLFPIDYLKTLIKIAGHAQEDACLPILKEAIDSVNELKLQETYRGQENPETAYHFMVVLGDLAEMTFSVNEVASAKIRLCQGKIARNLSANPSFPAESKESLANSMIAAAQGHAIAGEQKLALEAIRDAYELGFYEFEKLRNDELLAQMSDQKTFLSYLEQLEAAYKVKVKKWSKEAISQFQPFKFEFNVDDVDGGSLTNGSFDDQVLVVDFWATWCPPCRKGIPHFIELQQEFCQEGVQVLGISMDSPDDPESSRENVKEFALENGVTYPCGMGTNELTQRIPGEVKLPTTVFVDRLGNVRYIARGYQDYTKMAAIVETLAEEDQHVRVTTAR